MKRYVVWGLLWLMGAGCTADREQPLAALVDRALAHAERQSLVLARKYTDREGRLPRTWEKGEDVGRGSRGWCSGFFPGRLWDLYENSRHDEVLEYARMYTARVER